MTLIQEPGPIFRTFFKHFQDVNTKKKKKKLSYLITHGQGLDFVPSRENHIWFSPDSFARINWFSFYDKILNTAESNCYAN